MSAVSSGQNQSGYAGSLETPGKPSLQSNIASNLQVVADRSSALTDQLSELTSFVWSWLRQRSADSDFERLIGKIFFSLDSDDAFTVEQQSSVDQLQHDLASGSGLSPLDFQLIPRSSMPGLVGAYASQHPSGAPTVLINETWFDQATDQERVITLLQEIGHAVDDQLHDRLWDTDGDEGAYFARLILATQPEDVAKEWFNYDDHYILHIDGQAVAVEASSSNNAPTATYTTNHSVNEGGPVLVGVLTAIDPDLDTSITYSLVGDDVPGFEITNGSGSSSSTSTARLPLRSTPQNGELFLGGDFIELGISNLGSFGTTGSKPSDFYGTSDASDRIGLSNDADGFDTGEDLRIDFFLPGTPEERWSIGWDSKAEGSFSALVDGRNIGNLSDTSLANTSTATQLSGTFDSTVNNTAEVSQVHSFDPTKQFFKTSVTITNVDTSAIDDVLFMRSFDPDNTVYKGGSYSTTNKIEKTL